MNVIQSIEERVVLRRAEVIDPQSINQYVQEQGYEALQKAIKSMSPQDVIDEIQRAGLRGRGGAGFPTGIKWGFVRKVEGNKKYVICNADESEPGAFKDRLILENDPHSIVEAMTIAAYAVGADEGYIYIRGEEYFYSILCQILNLMAIYKYDYTKFHKVCNRQM